MPQDIAKTSSGCLHYELTANFLQTQTLPVGTYQVQLFTGPNLDPVGPTAKLDVTAPTAASSPSGAGH
jgi:hypothetical protein